ncbi:MAG: uncharacterized protein KVP18_000642, partial [Porospora cf. gigantea A]|uniref:uncharacterized protein n=2 Tax=Porospora cf. gigantea A TaxID=2853593 RepID=UPI0035597DC5
MVRSAPKPLRERSERQRIPQDDRNLLECAEIMLQCIFTSHEELRSTPLFTPKNLMSLISSLQVLMDTAVAGEFTKDFPVKLPASLFRDILLDPHSGCLRQIMEKALLFVHTRLSDSSFGNLRRLELHTAKTQNESVDLLPELYKTSVEAGLWKPPLVFIAFRKENPDLAKMCATRIRELGGRVGTGAWTQCSHLLLDVRISDDNEIFTRKVRIPTNDGADRCLTHYWYFPDSFDSGVFSSALPKETTLENPPENQKPEDGVWRVGIEWLEVSHRYREWANELDFEVPNDLMSLEFHIPEISDEEKDRPGKPDRPPTKPDKSAKVEKNDSPIVEKTPRRATRSHGVDSEYSPSETSQVSINRTPSPERKRPAPPLSARNKRHRFEQSGSDNLVISIACTPLPKVATAALILGSPALPDELPPLPPWDNELVAKDWLCKQQAVALAALGDDGFRRGIAPRVRRGPGRPPKQETFVWFYEQQADFLAEINALLGRDTSQGLENFSSAIASVGGAAPARWE